MFMGYWDSDYCVCVMLHDVRTDCVDVHGILCLISDVLRDKWGHHCH